MMALRRAPVLPSHCRSYATERARPMPPQMPHYVGLPPQKRVIVDNIIHCDRVRFCLRYIGDHQRADRFKSIAERARREVACEVPSIESYLDAVISQRRDHRDMYARVSLAESFGLTRRIAELNDFPPDIQQALARLHNDHTSAYFKS